MTLVYLYQEDGGFWSIYYDSAYIPEHIKSEIITANIPEYPEDGKGYTLTRNPETEEFYWKPIQSEEPEPTPEPEPEPVPPVETSIEKRLEQIELTSAYTQLQVDYVAFLTEILTTQPK